MPENVNGSGPIPNSERKNASEAKRDTKPIKTNTTPERSNGAEKIKRNSEPIGTPGTKELRTQNEVSNLPVVSGTDRSMGLKEHLENLREAQSGSMNLLDSTTVHLHGLMMSVADEAKAAKDDVRAWARDNTLVVKQTVEVARQLHNVMRLKLDSVKALHKISKDIADDEFPK